MSVAKAAMARSGPSVVLRSRRGRAAVLIHPRRWVVGAALLAVVVALGLIALAIGTQWIPLDDVVRGLIGTAERATNLTVQQFRMPRVVVGMLVGAALGLSGAIVQAVTRNPIAAPDVIGVTAGASFGAVVVLLAFGGATVGAGGAAAGLSQVGVPLGAVFGALVAATVVLGVGAGRSGGPGIGAGTQRIVLVGIVCHAAFIGLVHWGLARGEVNQAAKATVWLVGSLHGRGWEHVTALAAGLAILLPLVLIHGRALAALALGETSATTLGLRVRRTQLVLFALAFALTGTAVAAAGPVNFVALLAPLIARRLARAPAPPLVASALTGAALLLAADVLARLAIPGVELPAGAVTAIVGAPFLLWLVIRSGGSR